MKEYEQINEDTVIVKESKIEEQTYDLKEIEDAIINLKERLDEIPIKTEPDAETLEFWNMMNLPQREMILDELTYYENILNEMDEDDALPEKYKNLIK